MPAIKYINSQRGKKILITGNYLFNFLKDVASTKIWRCGNRKCKSRCLVNSSDELIKSDIHDHLPYSDEEIKAFEVKSSLKDVARTSINRSRSLVMEHITGLDTAVYEKLPREQSMSRSMCRMSCP